MKRISMIAILFIFVPTAQAVKKPKSQVNIKGKWKFKNKIDKHCRDNNGKIGKCNIKSKVPGNYPYPNGTNFFSITGFAKFSDNSQGTLQYNFDLKFTFANPNSKPIKIKRNMTLKFKVFKRKGLTYIQAGKGKDVGELLLTLKKTKKKTTLQLKMTRKNKCYFYGKKQPCFQVHIQNYER